MLKSVGTCGTALLGSLAARSEPRGWDWQLNAAAAAAYAAKSGTKAATTSTGFLSDRILPDQIALREDGQVATNDQPAVVLVKAITSFVDLSLQSGTAVQLPDGSVVSLASLASAEAQLSPRATAAPPPPPRAMVESFQQLRPMFSGQTTPFMLGPATPKTATPKSTPKPPVSLKATAPSPSRASGVPDSARCSPRTTGSRAVSPTSSRPQTWQPYGPQSNGSQPFGWHSNGSCSQPYSAEPNGPQSYVPHTSSPGRQPNSSQSNWAHPDWPPPHPAPLVPQPTGSPRPQSYGHPLQPPGPMTPHDPRTTGPTHGRLK